jgi:hypothetical protein
MSYMIGSLFFFGRLLGIAMIVATIIAAFVYHLGWRNENPGEVIWPFKSMLGYGGILLLGVGLCIGSMGMVVVGALAYVGSMWVKSKPVTPAV